MLGALLFRAPKEDLKRSFFYARNRACCCDEKGVTLIIAKLCFSVYYKHYFHLSYAIIIKNFRCIIYLKKDAMFEQRNAPRA